MGTGLPDELCYLTPGLGPFVEIRHMQVTLNFLNKWLHLYLPYSSCSLHLQLTITFIICQPGLTKDLTPWFNQGEWLNSTLIYMPATNSFLLICIHKQTKTRISNAFSDCKSD